MKKIITIFLIIVQTVLMSGCENKNLNSNSLEIEELNYDEIKDKLIRFHVIANSDTEEDQNLKLKVRDKVIETLSTKLSETKSVDEARKVLSENISLINEIAKKVVLENNYDYNVNTVLSNENFPDKIYGNYLFPQGEYEAFRVIIGNGNGHNWWCVMFPPLCFVDETKDTVNSEKLEQNIDQIVTEDDKKDNSKKNKSTKKVKYKFKVVEFFQDLFS